MIDKPALLHSLTDGLNEAIGNVESQMQALGLGVPASVQMDGTHDLIFSKIDGTFQLAIENDDGQALIRTVSRSRRIRAAALLEPLYDQLRTNVDLEIKAVERATALIAQLGARIAKEPV